MKKITACLALFAIVTSNSFAGSLCTPNATTAFSDFNNKIFRISNDTGGNNSLFEQCSDLSNENLLGQLTNCAPLPPNPINGLGLNPTDKLLYGLSPTDGLGIGVHLQLTLPFPAPGEPGDMMQADNMDIYKIGNDAGFQNIGFIQPPTETVGLPAGIDQVIPIVQNAASFNQNGDLFVLAYRTNYSSSANVALGTAQVLYQAPQIMIGQIDNATLTNATGGVIATTWVNIDDNTDSTCLAVKNKFRDDTNVFSDCVVNQYLATGDENTSVQNCLASTPILDKGIHDFAVSPINGHYYAYDSMTYDDKDVLIDVNPTTKVASCTEIPDVGNTTGVITSVMFSKLNKLVVTFANQSTGSWIDVGTGSLTSLPSPISASAFGDGSSLPFAGVTKRGTVVDLIFQNGFEPVIDLIFMNGFEGSIPPLCSDF